ncbi:alanine transaminase [Gammaproteobacteria bacterium]|nr:alanine transaminase [Gammaproteobacteria bacterium]MEC8448924.1 alanine transaminase [Pseudomonadota bacterium]MEC8798032.1 alanine transaminase [Pseudomonadota bacterium]|tara:strand:- start:125 stop:1324 length:1200 start_codon:yes stop_codon:yes gene_type:complete
MDSNFPRVNKLPPYVFDEIQKLKAAARKRGEDIIDFGMGNPDQSTPEEIVEKLRESVLKGPTHRYSQSKGIPRLRKAICDWYSRKYSVELDPETEAVVTMGSKEGLGHLALATLDQGDGVLVPNPSYPIHPYGFVIAGADIRHVPIGEDIDFFSELESAVTNTFPKPKMLVLNFPGNPSTECVEIDFFEKIVDFAKKNKIWVIQDLAYADICFDGYKAPSILQVDGAKDVAVEFFTLSKSYNMPGWRVGFCCGNKELLSALSRIKSYFDYGLFTPIQVAAIKALDEGDKYVDEIRDMYQSRRDVLIEGLNKAGWKVESPKATMFIWAKIPSTHKHLGSLEFSKQLLSEAQVAVSPGIGFGTYGEGYVRFSLIENEHRSRQAIRNIKKFLSNTSNIQAVN